jgi:hypothetical protein
VHNVAFWAQSGHGDRAQRCPLSEVKRTWRCPNSRHQTGPRYVQRSNNSGSFAILTTMEAARSLCFKKAPSDGPWGLVFRSV